MNKTSQVLLKIVGVRSRRIYFVSYYLIPNPFATYFKPSRIGEFHGTPSCLRMKEQYNSVLKQG